MKHKRYLPETDEGKVTWLNAFNLQLPTYAALFGIDPAVVTSLLDDGTFFGFLIGLMPAFKDYQKTLIDYKDIIRDGGALGVSDVPAPPGLAPHIATGAGIFQRAASVVGQIKAHPAYTELIGANLGIIGEEITVDYDTAKPNPKGTLKNSHAYLKWDNMHADGANIAVDYTGGTNYKFIGHVVAGHFLDAHTPDSGVAQKFAYIVRLTLGPEQEEVGSWSDPVFVTVTGQELMR
ncbi:MAG: hypothetical protein IPP77_15195 [Bacteroidetes bacterium]|nr:hypothetical protein [Bacteroidota bacterium]